MSSSYYKGLTTALLKTILFCLLVIPLEHRDNISHKPHLQHEQDVLSICLPTFL